MENLKQYLKDNKEKAYSFATKNTNYNAQRQPVISKNDEWVEEKEWEIQHGLQK